MLRLPPPRLLLRRPFRSPHPPHAPLPPLSSSSSSSTSSTCKHRLPLLQRPFSSPPSPRRYPHKDAQDRAAINTDATEYSKSGSDAAVAHEDAAFDPATTRPEEEKREEELDGGGAGKKKGTESDGNSLDMSPANHDVSKPKGGAGEGAGASARASGQEDGYPGGSGGKRGSPAKGGKVI